MSDTKVALGCSHTYGVGVEKYEAWPALLEAVNYGVIGCSSDFIARTMHKVLEIEKPKIIYLLWPDWTRFEYFKNGEWIQSLASNSDRINYMEIYTESWLRNNFAQQVAKVKKTCNDNDIKLYHMTLYDITPYHNHADRWPKGTDDCHYGPEWHQWVANLFKTHNEFPIAYD